MKIRDLNKPLFIPAVGLSVSVLLLVFVMLVFPFVNLTTTTGLHLPEAVSFKQYTDKLAVHYTFDTLFIFAWLVGWTGIVSLVWENSKPLAILTFSFAVAGKLLDFTENSMFWTQLPRSEQGDVAWLSVWIFISHLSYALPFGAVITAAAGLWSGGVFQKSLSLWGLLFFLPASVSLYYPQQGIIMGVWAWTWFIMASILLWKAVFKEATGRG